MKLPKSWTTVTPLSKFIAFILFVSLPFVGFIFGEKYQRLTTVSNSLVIPSCVFQPTSIPTPKTEQIGTGTIEGSLIYPSDYIPDQTVCALNLETNKETCTKKNIIDKKRFTSGKGYQLTLPTGNYNVYVDGGSVKIYYNEFVTCGLAYGCPSHDPIVVQVKANQTLTNIDPQDWYYTYNIQK